RRRFSGDARRMTLHSHPLFPRSPALNRRTIMRRIKLQLRPEELRVESFGTTTFAGRLGTVAAHEQDRPFDTAGDIPTCERCDTAGDDATCQCASNQATCDTCVGPNCKKDDDGPVAA